VGLLDRLGSRKQETDARSAGATAAADDPIFGTKALPKFLSHLTARETPVLLDLGPVVGGNVSFFGEQLGCKIFVEDIFADLDRHVRAGTLDALPEFLKTRLPQETDSVDGILCWDLFDFLDKPSSLALAKQIVRMLRSGGAVMGFFCTAAVERAPFTKFEVIDDQSLRHKHHAGTGGAKTSIPNRDIIKMFEGLVVAESFLLKNSTREILLRKRA
jgi:hypothetical protein